MGKLLDVLRSSLTNYGYSKALDVVNNNVESAKFISDLLKELDLPESRFSQKEIKEKFRINHILFTFILGLTLSEFGDLNKKISNEYMHYFDNDKDVFAKVWLMTALYHDYGYFAQNKYSTFSQLKDISVEYSIFEFGAEEEKAFELFGIYSDRINKPRYSYEIYDAYYSCYYKKKNKDEPVEHGIVGGYILFDDIMKYNNDKDVSSKKKIKKAMGINKNTVKNDYFYQDLCYRIMEHNVWTIDLNDPFFKEFNVNELKPIFKGDFKKIGISEPLLMLLSLTDTIEYIKKMSTNGIDKPKAKNYPTTIAKRIDLNVTSTKINIVIDKEVEKYDGFEDWKRGIANISDWVEIKSKYDNCEFLLESKYGN